VPALEQLVGHAMQPLNRAGATNAPPDGEAIAVLALKRVHLLQGVGVCMSRNTISIIIRDQIIKIMVMGC